MTSGWAVTVEVVLILGLAIGWGWRELRALDRLKAERERKAREEAGSGGEG
jgi:hypothetical protein